MASGMKVCENFVAHVVLKAVSARWTRLFQWNKAGKGELNVTGIRGAVLGIDRMA